MKHKCCKRAMSVIPFWTILDASRSACQGDFSNMSHIADATDAYIKQGLDAGRVLRRLVARRQYWRVTGEDRPRCWVPW
jgi:hypothetical protein